MRIGRREVKLTNQDKIYFPGPGLTKGDLIAYYVDVADCVLHHVRRRPMQMKRYPDGVDGFFFYQEKNPTRKGHATWGYTPSFRHNGGGEMSPTPTIATIDAEELLPIFARYHTRLVNRGRKPQTVANFVRSVVPFQHFLATEGLKLEDVSEEVLERYFSPSRYAATGYSAGTRRLHAVQVSAALRYAHRRGEIPSDPTVDFEKPPEPDPDPAKKLLTSAQLRQCWQDCPTWRHQTLFALLAFTGCRRDEIRLLAWEDIDLAQNIIYIRQAKGDKRREIPVHPFLREVLLSTPANPLHGQGTPLDSLLPLGHGRTGAVLWTRDRKSFYAGGQSFEKLKRPFAPSYGFHHFRKTTATSLRRNGVDPGIIDKILGWSARSIQDKYYVTHSGADLHKAIARLYVDDPLGF